MALSTVPTYYLGKTLKQMTHTERVRYLIFWRAACGLLISDAAGDEHNRRMQTYWPACRRYIPESD